MAKHPVSCFQLELGAQGRKGTAGFEDFLPAPFVLQGWAEGGRWGTARRGSAPRLSAEQAHGAGVVCTLMISSGSAAGKGCVLKVVRRAEEGGRQL